MMQLSPLDQEINSALQSNLLAMKEAFLDLLAGVILCLTGLFSVFHAVVRLIWAGLGLLLWALALFLTFLQWLQAWVVARSSSTVHRR